MGLGVRPSVYHIVMKFQQKKNMIMQFKPNGGPKSSLQPVI